MKLLPELTWGVTVLGVTLWRCWCVESELSYSEKCQANPSRWEGESRSGCFTPDSFLYSRYLP